MKISSIGSVLLITALASCSGSSGAAQPSGTSQSSGASQSLSPFQSLEGLSSDEIREIQDRVIQALNEEMAAAYDDAEKLKAIGRQLDRWINKCGRATYEATMAGR